MIGTASLPDTLFTRSDLPPHRRGGSPMAWSVKFRQIVPQTAENKRH